MAGITPNFDAEIGGENIRRLTKEHHGLINSLFDAKEKGLISPTEFIFARGFLVLFRHYKKDSSLDAVKIDNHLRYNKAFQNILEEFKDEPVESLKKYLKDLGATQDISRISMGRLKRFLEAMEDFFNILKKTDF